MKSTRRRFFLSSAVLAVLVVLVLSVPACTPGSRPAATPTLTPPVTADLPAGLTLPVTGQTLPPELLQAISDYAVAQKLDRDEAVASSLETARREVLAGAAADRVLAEQPIADEELRRIFDLRAAAGDQEYHLFEISTANQETAAAAIAELGRGVPRADVQRTYGGGDLGWVNPTQIPDEIVEAIKSLRPGTYTREPVPSPFGWHVIFLEETRTRTLPSFEATRDKLLREQQNKILKDYVEGLRKRARGSPATVELLAQDALEKGLDRQPEVASALDGARRRTLVRAVLSQAEAKARQAGTIAYPLPRDDPRAQIDPSTLLVPDAEPPPILSRTELELPEADRQEMGRTVSYDAATGVAKTAPVFPLVSRRSTKSRFEPPGRGSADSLIRRLLETIGEATGSGTKWRSADANDISGQWLVPTPLDFPHRARVKLIMWYPNGAELGCSGVLIGPRTVLTAGHCVKNWEYGGGDWAKRIQVIPALDGTYSPFGWAYMTGIRTVKGWAEEQEGSMTMPSSALTAALGTSPVGWVCAPSAMTTGASSSSGRRVTRAAGAA